MNIHEILKIKINKKMNSLLIMINLIKYYYNIFFLLSLLLLFNKSTSLISFKYPSSISLLNHNFFIVEEKGIYVYDKDFKYIVKSYLLAADEQINSLDQLSEVIIKYQNEYLICLINSKIYFFDKTGTKLLITEKVILDDIYYHPTLAPIFNKSGYYYFVIGYFILDSGKYKLKLLYYKINLTDYSYSNFHTHIDDDFESFYWFTYKFKNKGLSCDYMVDDDNYDDYYLLCFFIIEGDDGDELAESFYIMDESEIKWTGAYNLDYIITDDIKNTIQIKTVTTSNLRNILVALLLSTNKINYYKYYYKSVNTKFYESSTANFDCRNTLYSMKLNYLSNNNYIVLSCINSYSTVQA